MTPRQPQRRRVDAVVARADPPVGGVRRLLAPGVQVVDPRRGVVYVGLDVDRKVALADTGEVRASLAALAVGAPLPPGDRVLTELEAHDLVVESAVLSALAGARRPPLSGPDVAALALDRPRQWRRLAGARSARRVAFLGEVPESLPGLVAAAGLTHERGADPLAADVVVVGAHGELDRAVLDPLVRADRPHLVLRLWGDRACIGPFVQPGRTPCLRCIDAHHDTERPGYAALVDRFAAAAATPRPDGVPDPVDTALATLVAAWAARDLATFADGRRPSCWARTVSVGADLRELTSVSWLRYPECGCARPSVTMGA